MRLKLFRAATMAEAMARVRAELGAEAIILATRQVAEGIELTAALEAEDEPVLIPPLPPPQAAMAAGPVEGKALVAVGLVALLRAMSVEVSVDFCRLLGQADWMKPCVRLA